MKVTQYKPHIRRYPRFHNGVVTWGWAKWDRYGLCRDGWWPRAWALRLEDLL